MAENKKSVLLYCDIIHTVKELTNEEAGKLFKHYLEYINDLNPTPPDKLTQIVFEPIKQNLKRDLVKWNEKSLRNSEIAKEGWEKRKNANTYERIRTHTKNADKDKVTDTVTVIVTDKDTVTDKFINNKFSFRKSLELLGADTKLIDDWLLVRKNKKATNSETAFNLLKNEFTISGLPINDILKICIVGSWSGFKTEWLKNISIPETTGTKFQQILTSRNTAHDYIKAKHGANSTGE